MSIRAPIRLDPAQSKLAELIPSGRATTIESEADELLAAALAGRADASSLREGFLGVIDDRPPRPEATVGKPDFLPVWFLRIGAQRARAVCHIEFDRDGRGWVATGFMVSPALMLTNHHVFACAEQARGARVFFDYEADEHGRQLNPCVFLTEPDRMFVANERLDFCLVAIAGDPGERWGTIPLRHQASGLCVGERVNLIQHPSGRLKEIVVQGNEIAEVDALSIHYLADTEAGSSGAPVFNQRWDLIALHHLGSNSRNVGVRIDALLKWLAVAAAEGVGGPVLADLLARVPDSGDLGWFAAHGLTPPSVQARESDNQPRERAALRWVGGGEYLDVACWRLPALVELRVEPLVELIERAGSDLLVLERMAEPLRAALRSAVHARGLACAPLGKSGLLVLDPAMQAALLPANEDQRALLASTMRGQPVVAGSFVQLQLTLARAGAGASRRVLLHFVELERELGSRAHQAELARVLRSLALASGEDVVSIGAIAELSEQPSWTGCDLGVLRGPGGTGLAWMGDGQRGRLERVILDAETSLSASAAEVIAETHDRTLPSPPELAAIGRPLLARLCFGECGTATVVAATAAPTRREITIDAHVRTIVID